jgi:hypothetical protein
MGTVERNPIVSDDKYALVSKFDGKYRHGPTQPPGVRDRHGCDRVDRGFCRIVVASTIIRIIIIRIVIPLIIGTIIDHHHPAAPTRPLCYRGRRDGPVRIGRLDTAVTRADFPRRFAPARQRSRFDERSLRRPRRPVRPTGRLATPHGRKVEHVVVVAAATAIDGQETSTLNDEKMMMMRRAFDDGVAAAVDERMDTNTIVPPFGPKRQADRAGCCFF